MTTRYTAKNLAERVEQINEWLAEDNSPIRFETGGRNGYTAVDEYSVDTDGSRVNSGYNRTVGYGTPRRCAAYTNEAYGNEVARLRRETAA